MVDLSHLKPQKRLNARIWDPSGHPRAEVSDRLMDIAQKFFEGLGVSEEFEDIRITGSAAGYNWNDLSDIDLHIILDFSKFGDISSLMKEFIGLKRFRWNDSHDIKIYGHEVEVYVQDESEPHYSPGQYSLLRREWVEKPEKIEKRVNYSAIKAKVRGIIGEIDIISDLFDKKSYKQANKQAERLFQKLKKLRKCGLEQNGIYSVENLAFKALRNADYISKLMILRSDSYDKDMSLGNGGQIMVKIEEIKGKQAGYFKKLAENMAAIEQYFNKNVAFQGAELDDKDIKIREISQNMSVEQLLDPDHPAPWEDLV